MSTQKSYSYSKFSINDIRAYRPLLNQLPYDERLENTFMAFKRESRRQKRADERHLDARELHESIMETEALRRATSVWEQVEANMLHAQLYAALKQLSEKSKNRIFLHFFFGLTHMEIARVEGISQPAITKSINRSLQKLKKLLE